MVEQNVIRKDFRKIELKVALCYPNLYQAGIACHAIQLLYYLFNSFENVECERFYYDPKQPPKSVETGQGLKNFDIICFSLQYELDYMNLLKMLSSTGIPLLSEKRTKPLIIAGGPCALENPLPLFSFIDIFVLGDLEPILDQLINYLNDYMKGKQDLQDFHDIPGVLVPHFYQDQKIIKSVASDLGACFHPTFQLISDTSPFGKSLLVEVSRGCPRGCKFCLIGYQSLPVRFRPLNLLKQIILDGVENSQVDKISLIGTSLSDYSHLQELCEFILEQQLQLALPSLRVEVLTRSLLEVLQRTGVRSISIAPEAGSERLRTAIGKDLSEERLLGVLSECSEIGIENIKMYFIINLPTETFEDIEFISDLLRTVIQRSYPPNHLNLSINPFIPKPHTPFQWEPPIILSTVQNKMKSLERSIRTLKIYNFEFLDPRWARIQGFLSRADRNAGEILLKVLKNGATLGAWRKIPNLLNYSFEDSQVFEPTLDESLPWDFIDLSIEKQKLLILHDKARD